VISVLDGLTWSRKNSKPVPLGTAVLAGPRDTESLVKQLSSNLDRAARA
jgi:hypothetical protein